MEDSYKGARCSRRSSGHRWYWLGEFRFPSPSPVALGVHQSRCRNDSRAHSRANTETQRRPRHTDREPRTPGERQGSYRGASLLAAAVERIPVWFFLAVSWSKMLPGFVEGM